MYLNHCEAFHGKTSACPTRVISSRRVLGLLVGLTVLATALEAVAQIPLVRRRYPADDYYLAVRLFEQGEFADAGKAFRSSAGSGFRSSEGPWVDSICYLAMMGECYYQLGDLGRRSSNTRLR